MALRRATPAHDQLRSFPVWTVNKLPTLEGRIVIGFRWPCCCPYGFSGNCVCAVLVIPHVFSSHLEEGYECVIVWTLALFMCMTRMRVVYFLHCLCGDDEGTILGFSCTCVSLL